MRFDQVKMLAGDVVALTRFYTETFDFPVVREPTEIDDADLNRPIGAPPQTTVTLSMLGLPGQGEGGAILELYSLSPLPTDWPYQPGQGQIAFEVEDVDEVASRIVANGGAAFGEVTNWRTPSGNTARFVYMRDSEGNLIDLWRSAGGASDP